LVIVDHNKNIQRIIDVIKADSDLFDNGTTPGKLRSAEFGDPPNKVYQNIIVSVNISIHWF